MQAGAPEWSELDDREAGLIVEHYRVDAARALWRALAPAAFIMSAASIFIASAFVIVHRGDGRSLHTHALLIDRAHLRGPEVDFNGNPIGGTSVGWELSLTALGIGCVLLAGAIAIVGLRRALSTEAYLALRTDGALFRDGAVREHVRWDDVLEVQWDEVARVLRFERRDGSEWVRAERFAGVEGSELAKRVREIRRKALFNLIKR